MHHSPFKSISDKGLNTRNPWCEQALDRLGDPLHVVDRDLRIISANHAFIDWLGILDLDVSLVGKHLSEAFPFLPSNVIDEYHYVFETGEILVTSECTVLGEKEIYTETRKMPVIEESEVVRVVTVIHDVTDQRYVELAFQDYSERFYLYRVDREQRFRAIFDESPVSICVIDSDGIITDVNTACANLFGLSSRNVLIGFDIFESPDVSEWVKERVQSGERVDFEWILDMDRFNASVKCGSSRTGTLHIGVIVSPLLDHELLHGWIVQMQDITRWRYAQMEIQRAQDVAMEYMDLMSHDIANHLQSMIMCTGLLDEVARDAGKGYILEVMDEAMQECIKIIAQARKMTQDTE